MLGRCRTTRDWLLWTHAWCQRDVLELRKDIAAVQAELDLPWTTSPAEGQVNRIKLIKRSMYGRAGFDLLRARVMHAA